MKSVENIALPGMSYDGWVWHGIGSKEAWDRVMGTELRKAEGLRLGMSHAHDAGDYGLGVYFTTSVVRAECYAASVKEGRALVRAKVKLERALVVDWRGGSALDPEHPTTRLTDHLTHLYGNPVRGTPESRVDAAAQWRIGLLKDSFDGVVVVSRGDTEVVVYRPESSISMVTPIPLKSHP